MKFLERNLEDILFECDKDDLKERGLLMQHHKLKRQLRIGNYGTADIVGFDMFYNAPQFIFNKDMYPYLQITIYELKKDVISAGAFLQAIGYAKGISRYLQKRKFNFDFAFKIVLVGYGIDRGNLCFLSDLWPLCNIDNIEDFNGAITGFEMYKYDYSITGLSFQKIENYTLTNEGL